MNFTKNIAVLSGACATFVLATAIIPASSDGAWSQHIVSAAFAQDNGATSGYGGSGGGSSSDHGGSGGGSSSDHDGSGSGSGTGYGGSGGGSSSSHGGSGSGSGTGYGGSGGGGFDGDRGSRDRSAYGINRDDNRKARDDNSGFGRSSVQLQLDPSNLPRLLDGSLVAVDNLNRVLEVELSEPGSLRVVARPRDEDARQKPGRITSVRLLSSSQVRNAR
ncbi:hypothetical protein [Oricola cellulosilytica]|uniref:hypothetical protein n=1 Tax=Oricola cellulosilytica TaxID=1429082 RepID=UPI0018EE8BBF|nr:hypothetical protein [Oricola cellulosilytica]